MPLWRAQKRPERRANCQFGNRRIYPPHTFKLATYRRRLADQLQQLASQGGLHAPPGLLEGIRKARREIARSKDVLRGWSLAVEDLPDDLDSQEATPRRLRSKQDTNLQFVRDMRINPPDPCLRVMSKSGRGERGSLSTDYENGLNGLRPNPLNPFLKSADSAVFRHTETPLT